MPKTGSSGPTPTSARRRSQWVSRIDGHPVGHVALTRPGDREDAVEIMAQRGMPVERSAVVARLFVLPAARGRGVGGELMRTVAVAASDLSLIPILEVLAKDRAALRLYEDRGWETIGETTHRHGSRSYSAVALRGPSAGGGSEW